MHVTHCVSTECVLNGLTLAILSLLSGRASVLIKLEGQGLVTFFFSLLSLTLGENIMKVVGQNKVQIVHAVGQP